MFLVVAQQKPPLKSVLVLLSFTILLYFSGQYHAQAEDNPHITYVVTVLDEAKKPIPNFVVEFHLNTPDKHPIEQVAIMDQVQEQFKPHILTIEKGTLVSFPNSDNIKHHVYSFSQAKSFEQGLYKGKQALPINFDIPGVVDLGCNIHDWMLGYIYVAESHFYAKTNSNGQVTLAIPNDLAKVSAWHPRMQESEKRLTITPNNSETNIVFQLKNKMREDAEGYEDVQLDVY